MISGFMVLKNVLKTGYPFVESIASSLPVCDEFLIGEGYSTDGTYEVIQQLAQLNKKIKVIRQEWPNIKSYRVIAEVTNAIRAKCSHEYIFSLQANEVIHEKSVDYLKALPEICPEVNAFSLPFIHLVKDYKFFEDYRLRFTKNLSYIQAVSDAWTLGPSEQFTNSERKKTLTHPRRMIQYINKGVEWTFANSCVSPQSRAIYLPAPIYRYWSLYPADYIEKCEKHIEMFGLTNLQNDIDILKTHLGDLQGFWRKAAEIRRKELHFNYPDTLGRVELEAQPKIMQDLITDSTKTSYSVRPEVLESIKGL